VARRPVFDCCENSRASTVFHARRRPSPLCLVGCGQSEWMSITGSSSGEAWTTSRSKVGLDELISLGGRASGWRHRRRLDRLAHVREGLAIGTHFGD